MCSFMTTGLRDASVLPARARLPKIYYDPRSAALNRNGAAALHAKFVVVDGEHVFISSANFTEAGQIRNIELGVLLRSRFVGERITGFFDGLIKTSKLVSAG